MLLLLTTGCTTGVSQPGQTTITGKAIKIIDGDTFDLLTNDNQTMRIRLFGIDCPERGQPFYKVCKTALGDLCNGQQLKIVKRDVDRYKRCVADVYRVSDNKWINELMVARGVAWHYTHYSSSNLLSTAETKARNAKRGLWQDPSPIAPWEWRKEKRLQHQ